MFCQFHYYVESSSTTAKKKKKKEKKNKQNKQSRKRSHCRVFFTNIFIYSTLYNTEHIFCTKLITYTIGLLLPCVTPSFLSKAVSSKPICGPFHNLHVFHLTSILLYVRIFSSRDEGSSSGTKNKNIELALETHSEPFYISKMKRLAKLVNCF